VTIDTQKAKKRRHEDRITLNDSSLNKVDSWISQVTSLSKGVSLNRRDLVNWFIENQDDALSPSVAHQLKTSFFNELRFLNEAIKEVRSARTRGETVNLKN
jgi:hypothetical protein